MSAVMWIVITNYKSHGKHFKVSQSHKQLVSVESSLAEMLASHLKLGQSFVFFFHKRTLTLFLLKHHFLKPQKDLVGNSISYGENTKQNTHFKVKYLSS